MSTCNPQFTDFLKNIQPDENQIKFAKKAHNPLRDKLSVDEDFRDYYNKSYLYGSYRRNTAITPIKDIDIVLVTNFDPEETKPIEALKILKKALDKYFKVKNTEYQRKSIKIIDALPEEPETEMTLDVIPAVVLDESQTTVLVPDIEANEWVISNPKGHLDYITDLNSEKRFEGLLVPVIKIMKHWWSVNKSNPKAKPKGFWLEFLIAEHMSVSESYAECFITVLQSILDQYSDLEKYISPPELEDPGLDNELLKTSMTIEEFKDFMDKLRESLDMAHKAIEEEDEEESAKLWQEILGPSFPIKSDQSKTYKIGDASHAKTLADMGWKELLNKDISLNIHARLAKKKVKSYKDSLQIYSGQGFVPSGRYINFEAITNTSKKKYEIYWQVVNTGEHAKSADLNGSQMRGEIFKSTEREGDYESNVDYKNKEHTQYTGVHWVEVFLIDTNNAVCVARSGRFIIQILNNNK